MVTIAKTTSKTNILQKNWRIAILKELTKTLGLPLFFLGNGLALSLFGLTELHIVSVSVALAYLTVGILFMGIALIWIILLGMYFTKRRWKLPKPENQNKLSKNINWLLIVKIIIFIATIFIGIHQLVQPIYSPRIDSISITPLYVQSDSATWDKSEIQYYKVFKIKYDILPTLFFSSTINIKLPQDTTLFTSVTGFVEKNPYVEWSDKFPYVIDSNKNKSISFRLTTSGLTVKEFPLTLFFREKVELECARLEFSNDKWWSETQTNPNEIPKIECSNIRKLGFGQIEESGVVFSFSELIIRNRGELDIRGFIAETHLGDSPQIRFCEDNREMTEIFVEDRNLSRISIDLKSGETRRLMILMQEPSYYKSDFSKIDFGRDMKNFTFENSGCNGDWHEAIQ